MSFPEYQANPDLIRHLDANEVTATELSDVAERLEREAATISLDDHGAVERWVRLTERRVQAVRDGHAAKFAAASIRRQLADDEAEHARAKAEYEAEVA